MAREWPHLRNLIDGTDLPAGLTAEQARELAARTLAVVQGHPKLIELADGQPNDPAALTARLEEADQTWLTQGTRLDVIPGQRRTHRDRCGLSGGAAGLGPLHHRRAARDRRHLVPVPVPAWKTRTGSRSCIDGNWADLWQRLGRPGDPPDPDSALVPLVEQALVAADLDPDTGAGGSATEFIRGWPRPPAATPTPISPRRSTPSSPPTGWLLWITRSIMRVRRSWAGWCCGRPDPPPRTCSANTAGTTSTTPPNSSWAAIQHRHRGRAAAHARRPPPRPPAAPTSNCRLGRTHARALVRLQPEQAETLLQRAAGRRGRPRQQLDIAANLAADLINLYRDRGRFDEALTLADTA